MTMDSLEQIKRKLAKEKAEFEVELDMAKRDDERKRLKAELRKTKFEKAKLKAKPVISFFGSLAKTGSRISANLEANEARQEYGINIGDTVKITNGSYSGKSLKITNFISGGIEGTYEGNSLRIRHGSYRK